MPNTPLFSAVPAKHRLTPMPPCRGDCTPALRFRLPGHFDPRPHAGATPDAKPEAASPSKFQSTPPCGGDVVLLEMIARRSRISIHAPMRGRPQWPECIADRFGISIHAPMRGRLSDEAVRFHLTFPSFFREGQVFILSKPHFPVLFLSVCFPFALTAPWGPRGRRSFWLPGAGFCSDRCCPGCRTAGCRGLCR